MANKDETTRPYSLQEEQEFAREAAQRGMTVEELKAERVNEREQITNQNDKESNK